MWTILEQMISVADWGGPPPAPSAQNVLNFMQYFGYFDKIMCCRPLEGWRSLLDPPPGSPPPRLLVDFLAHEGGQGIKWNFELTVPDLYIENTGSLYGVLTLNETGTLTGIIGNNESSSM